MKKSNDIFPWNNNFDTGIPQIDEQHKRLVQLLNLLASNITHQHDMPTLNIIFTELAEYAMYHFETEEDLWGDFLSGDSWEIEHVTAHKNFVSEMIHLEDEEDTKPLEEVIGNVLSFLTHWLAFHILESDKRMSKVVLAMQADMSLEQAKIKANQDMNGSLKMLLDTVLSMYDSLSVKTLQLVKGVIMRQNAEAMIGLGSNAPAACLESVCITDEKANIIDANPAFYRTMLLSKGEINGANLRKIKAGLGDEILSLGIWDTIASKGNWSGEINSRTQSGEHYPEDVTLVSIKNEQGIVCNYIGVFLTVSIGTGS
jgi:hemerythrin-like metal-binding protein